jgi:hypothetical protein
MTPGATWQSLGEGRPHLSELSRIKCGTRLLFVRNDYLHLVSWLFILTIPCAIVSTLPLHQILRPSAEGLQDDKTG